MTHVSEVILGWLGWCPDARTGAANLHADITTSGKPVTADRQVPPDDEILRAMGKERYRNTQISYFLTAAMVVALFMGIFDLFPPVLAILVVIGLLMSASLTVAIYDNLLEIRVGPSGLITRKIWFTEIESVSIEEKPESKAISYLIPRADPRLGTGVTMLLRDGKWIRVYTGRTCKPEELRQAIENALAGAAPVSPGSVPA